MLARLGRISLTRPVTIPRNCSQVFGAQGTTHKAYRARVNALLLSADRRLLSPRADTLESYLMTHLSDAKFYNTYRANAFMRVIRFSLERHLFDLAIAVYDRMVKEGFVAVQSLALRVTALKIAQQATKLADAALPLKKLFEEKAYDPPAFTDLVHYLANDKHASGMLVDDLGNSFVTTRQLKLSEFPQLIGTLARVNMRANRLDAAQRWLQMFEDACGTQGVLPDVAPYSIIISTLNDINPKDGDAIQDVLVRMKSAGVSPDVNVFNALIRVNFVQQRYREAFALYHILMEKRSRELMPTDVTYKMLFRANHLSTHPRARRHRLPENAVPPRILFREMLESHLERTNGSPLERSTVVSVSAFHLALRTYMAREDYAASYIAIHALHALGFQTNLQTYLVVLSHLLGRMKREASTPRPPGTYRLVDFLTYLRPNEAPVLQTLLDRIHDQPASEHTGVGMHAMSHLLALAGSTRPAHDLAPVPNLPPVPYPRAVRIPTAAMLTGAQDPSTDRALFSHVPLARLVYRALQAELLRKAAHRPADWDWKGAAGSIIAETARAMVPEGMRVGQAAAVEKRAEVLPFAAARMRRRRRGARSGREIAFDFES